MIDTEGTFIPSKELGDLGLYNILSNSITKVS